MSSYHTDALKDADVFTIMGSIYAEVARYDNAISLGRLDQAEQAASRAEEIIDFSNNSDQLNTAQKDEIKQFKTVFLDKVRGTKKSNLDGYLMPFAVAQRMRQSL